MFRETVPAATVTNRVRIFCQVINRVGKITDFVHKWGQGFGKRTAHSHPIILGVPLPAPRGRYFERLLRKPNF